MKNQLLIPSSSKNIFTGNRLSVLFFIVFISIYGQVAKAQNCTVNANVDIDMCSNQALTLRGAASGSLVGSTTWSQVSGPSVTITNPNNLITTVTGTAGNQTYRFRLSGKCIDGSLVFDEVVYKVNPITIANAGTDLFVCPGTHNLNGNAPQAGETGFWSVLSKGGISVSNPSLFNSPFVVEATDARTDTLIWNIYNITTNCISTSQVVIHNYGSIMPVDAGDDQNLGFCFSSTTSTRLAASLGGYGSPQTGTWSVVSGPNTPVFSDINSNTSTISNLITGTYRLRWTVAGLCSNGSDEMTITVPTAIADITNASASSQGFCDSRTSFVLTGNTPTYAGETISWALTSGQTGVTIANPTNSITGVTVTDPTGVYTFSYTISNSSTGCSTSATATITYYTPPTLTIDPTIYTLICNQTIQPIAFSSTGSGDVTVSIISGPTGTPYGTFPTAYDTTSVSPKYINNLTQPGTYVVRFRKTPGAGSSCSAIFKDITIIASRYPTASNAGTPQLLACNVTSTFLAGNEPYTGIGSWSQVSGPSVAVIADPYLSNTKIESLIPGVYKFKWTITGGPQCPAQQGIATVVVANTTPTQANAGTDQTVCHSTPVILQGNTPALNEVGTWTVNPAGPTFSNIHSPAAVVNGLAASKNYTFTWTIENRCGSTSDDVVISTNTDLGPIQALAGVDQCQPSGTTSITLNGNSPSPGAGAWTKLTGGGATITSPALFNSGVTGMANGTYTFEWAISYNACTVTRDTVMITISPATTTATAGSDQTICGTSVNLTGSTPTATETGTWTLSSGNEGPVIVSPNSPATSVTGLTNGTYQFNWTITNNACATSRDSVLVFVSVPPSTAVAGANQTLCGTMSTTLAATSPISGTGTWFIVSGPNTPDFDNLNSPTSLISGLITGTYVLQWQVSGGPYCPISTSNVTITAYQSANAGPNQTLCNVTTANLSGSVASTGTWTNTIFPVGYQATITTTGSNSATATNLHTGVYTFQYTIPAVAGCPQTSSTMTVTIPGQPDAAYAGPDQTWCGASSFSLNATPNPVSSGQTGTWTKLAGPAGGTFSNINSPTATYSPVSNGIYVFEWKVSEGTCSNTDQVRITNYTAPTTADAGPTQNVCGTTATMAANTPLIGAGSWSQVSGPNPATITLLVSPTTTITDLIPGTYVFRWEISNGLCGANSSDVTINVSTAPTAANAGANQSFCAGGAISATFNGNNITTGSGSWSQVSGPAATITPPASLRNTTVSLTGGVGDYVFQWTSTLGSCISSDQMTISVKPAVTTANAGIAQSVCLFDPITLSGNAPAAGETGTWTQTAGPTTVVFSNPNLYNTGVLGTLAGDYTFKWTIINGICLSSEATVNITVKSPPTLAIAGAPQDLCNVTATTLAANAPAGGETGTWTIDPGNPSGATITDLNNPSSAVSGMTVEGLYRFNWTISNSGCTSTDYVLIRKNPDVEVTVTSALNPTVCSGGTAVLSVSVTGGTGLGTYTYQWQSSPNGVDSWSDVGPNSATYTTPALAAGMYYRSIVNCGNVTSAISHVSVVADPTITSQPSSPTICSGASTTLNVTATGGIPPYVYEWQYYNGSAWVIAPGTATNSSYTTNALTQTTRFRVLISTVGAGCGTATSDEAIVYIPRITTQPVASNAAICVGGASSLTVVTEVGVPAIGYTYQWEYDNSGTWGNVSNGVPTGATYLNATTQILSVTGITATEAHNYRVIIKVPAPLSCTDLTSNPVTVNVNPDPLITVEPSAATICNGSTHTMSVTATGGTPFLNYQWERSPDGIGSWTPVGTDNSSYTTAALLVNTWYRVLVSATGNGCGVATSAVVKVTVNNLNPGSIGTAQTICEGDTPAGLTSVSDATAVEGGAAITYQWQSHILSGTYANIIGETNPTYNPGSLSVDTWYRRVATSTLNTVPCSSNSNEIIITVNNITANTIAGVQTICSGSSSAILTNSAATGDGTLTYLWESSPSDSPYVWGSTGVTTATYPTTVHTADTWYRRIITSKLTVAPQPEKTCTSISNIIRVTVNNLDPGAISGDQTICNPGDPGILSSTTPYSGDGTLSYQWYYRNSASGSPPTGWTSVGATGTGLTYDPPSGLAADRWYSRLTNSLLNGVTCNAATNLVRVTVNNVTAGTIQSAQTICEGGTPALLTTATVANPDGGVLTYQWESSTTSSSSGFSDIILNGTNADYQPLALTQDTWYRRRAISVLNGVTCIATSPAIAITVNNVTAGTIQNDQTICSGVAPVLLTTLTAATFDGAITYQWEISTTDATNGFSDIAVNGTNASYQPLALTQDTWFRRRAISTLNSVACTATSPAVKITVNNFTSVNTIASSQTICSGTATALTGNDVTADGTVTYQWQFKTSLAGSYTNVPTGGTGRDYTTDNLTANTWYQRNTISTLNGTCSLTSNEIKITIPSITTQPSSNLFSCEGDPYTMNVGVDFGTATPSYQWQFSDFDCSSGWYNISGATTASYTALPGNLPLVGGKRYFRVVISISSPTCTPALESSCAEVKVVGCNPRIGVAKQLVNITNNGDGTFNALFNIRVQNYGGTTLTNIQVTDNLNTGALAGKYSVLGISSTGFAVNTAFNGDTDQNLLLPIVNALARGASTDIRLSIKITSAGNYTNTVTASSAEGVSDASVNGSDPDVNQDGNPNESGPTPINTTCIPATAYAGADQTICASCSDCVCTTILTGATATNYSSLSWGTSGTGSFDNPTALNPKYTPSAADIAAGNVTLTITANSYSPCMAAIDAVVITFKQVTATIVSTNPNCEGGITGTATVTAGGGTAPYTYLWSNGQTTAAATGLTAGTHSVLVTDATGCSKRATVLLVDPTGVAATITASTNVLCNGASTGAATVTASGGTAPYTYLWSASAGGQITATATNLPAGNHTVTVTGTGGCTAQTMVTITQPAALTAVLVSQTNVLCLGVSTGTIVMDATGGTAPYTFSNDNGANYQASNLFTGLAANTYTMRVKDANNCESAAVSVIITQPAAVLSATTSKVDVSCFGAATGSATVTGSGGTAPYTYLWSNTKTDQTITGLIAGTYTVTVTDKNGCTAAPASSVIIGQPAAALNITSPAATLTSPTCNNGTNGSIDITVSGGTTPYTYAWTNGTNAADPTGLAAGSYSVTVTDAKGCTIIGGPYTLTNPAVPVFTASGISGTTCNALTGTVTLTGTGTGTVRVDGGAPVNSPATYTTLAAGYHTAIFTVTATGCTASTSFIINNTNSDLTGTAVVTDALCFGQTGSAVVTGFGGTGPYQYNIDNLGYGTATASPVTYSPLAVGSHNVKIKDSNGCTYTVAFDIDQPVRLVAQISSFTNVLCNAATNGTATAVATGGTAPYTYSWSNGQTTATATGLAAGTLYTVTITDANGCNTTASVTLSQPTAITLTEVSKTDPTCYGSNTGSINLGVSGGTAPYTYAWSNGFNGQDPQNLLAGTYTVVVTDANGCFATQTFVLGQPAALILNASGIVNTQCNALAGSVTLTEASNTAGTFTITGGTPQTGTTATFANLKAGFYTATFTATATGCTATTTFNIININSTLAATVSVVNPNCFGATVTATVTALGGTAPYSYSLNGGAPQPTGVFNTLPAGNYNVLVTDNNGCTYFVAFTIAQPTQLVAHIVASSNVTCFNAADGSATVDVTGGTTPYTYLWDDVTAQTSATAIGLVPGTYHVTVTDAKGCQVINVPVTITGAAAAMAISGSTTNPTCFAGTNGSVNITVTGGLTPYFFSWSNGFNGEDPSGLTAGSYTVLITDKNGCSATQTFVLGQPAALVLNASGIVNTQCNALVGSVTLTEASNTAGTFTITGGTPQTGTTATFANLKAGFYTATFTATATGCTATTTFNIININSTLAATVSVVNPNCFGATVTATVTALGGTAPYSYSLNGGAPQPTGVFNTLPAGNYNVLVTDNNGCTYFVAFTIAQPTQLVAHIVASSNVTCFNAADGSATVDVTGGTTPYTYLWDDVTAQTSATAIGLVPGTYHVTVTDAKGCQVINVPVTITGAAAAMAISGSTTNPTCFAGTNGSVNITVTGGLTPYFFSWSNGFNGEDPSGLTAGSYTVLITDKNGCSATQTFVLGQPAALVLNASGIVNTQCNALVGSVTLTEASNTAGTFTITGGTPQTGTTATFANLKAGFYTATFTATATGCTATTTFNIININSTLAATVSVVNPNCFGATVTATVTALGGTAPYSYSLNGGAPQPTGVFNTLAAGNYNVLVTDNNVCTYFVAFTIAQPTQLVAHIVASSNVTCFNAADGTATVDVTGGTTPYTYLWDDLAAQTTPIATGLATGTYHVTVTDAKGCQVIGVPVTITGAAVALSATASVVDVLCKGNATGSAIVTASNGTAPYTYLWSNGSTDKTANGLIAGTYSVIVTDKNGCTFILSPVSISEPDNVLSASITAFTNPSCEGGTTGSATVTATGGTGTYSYLWSNGQTAPTATLLTAGTHSVIVTDANGCTKKTTVLLVDPTGVTATISASTNVSCNGGTNGSATVTATGGSGSYTFTWSGTVTQASNTANPNAVTGLAAGNYSVTVLDSKGCSTQAMVTITQPTLLVAHISASTNVSCFGAANGSATVLATGGTTPYTYAWPASAASQTTATATNLEPGTYIVTVTDANLCTKTASVTITQPAIPIAISGIITNPTCNPGNDGSINITVTGGTAPYSFVWSNGSSLEDPAGLMAGTYRVTVTDALGCKMTSSNFTLTNPTAVTLTATSIVNTNCNASVGSVVLTSSDGSTITLGMITQPSGTTFSGLSAGFYTAKSNGICPAKISFNITNTNSTLSGNITKHINVSCFGGNDGEIGVTATNGTSPYTYSLNGGPIQPTGSFKNLTAGEYGVRITDANGCSHTVSFDIDEPNLLILTQVSKSNVLCNGSSNGMLTVLASGGTTTYTYSVFAQPSGGTNAVVNGNVISNMEAGAYIIRVTDANKCTADLAIVITGPPSSLNITNTPATISNPLCYGTASGSIDITVTGGTPPYSYAWSNGTNAADPTGLVAGVYTVTVTDANGCTVTGGPYYLSDPAPITLIASSIVNTKCNASVGSVILTSSDNSRITLNGVTQQSGTVFSGLSAGFYTATSNGSCPVQTGFNINNSNSTLTANVTSQTNVSCYGGANGAIAVNAVNGTAPYSYKLNGGNGQTNGVFNNLVAGDYNMSITDAIGCSYSISFRIDQPAILNLTLSGQTNAFCNGSSNGSVILIASGGAAGYTYSVYSEPPGGTNAVVINNVISNMEAGVYIIRVKDANGCIADQSITITEPGAVTVSAGNDATICESETYSLNGSVANNFSSIQWSTLGNGYFNNINSLHPVYTPGMQDLINGSVTLILSVSQASSCPAKNDTMVLKITRSAIVSAGPDAGICEGSAFQVSNAASKYTNSISWTHNGKGNLTGANTLTPTYNPATSETGEIILTLNATSAAPCSASTDQMIIRINPKISATAGLDLTACDMAPVIISGAKALHQNTILWTTNGSGTFNNATLVNPTYTPSAADLKAGVVKLTMLVTGIAPCDNFSDELEISLVGAPIANAGTDASICQHSPFTVSTATAENYASLSWVISPENAGKLINGTSLTPTFTPSPDFIGIVTLTLTVKGKSACGTSEVIDKMTLLVNSNIKVNAGIDKTIPQGSATILNATVSGGSGFYVWNWEPAQLLVNPNVYNPVTVPLSKKTTFVLHLLDLNTGCIAYDTVTILMGAVIRPPVATVDTVTTVVNIPVIIISLKNDTTQLGTHTTVSYCGYPKHGVVVLNSDNTFKYSPFPEYVGDDEFCYMLCDDSNPVQCDTALVKIRVKPGDINDLNPTGSITPNGDGSNEKWIIRGIENYPDNRVLIFNRWGDHIRDFAGYDNKTKVWDGTNDSFKPVPDGTYYYIIKIANVEAKTGWIFIRNNDK